MTVQLNEIQTVRVLMSGWGIMAFILTFLTSNVISELALPDTVTVLIINGIGILMCSCIFAYLYKLTNKMELEQCNS